MLRSRYRRITFFFARVIITIFVCDLLLPRIGLRSWSRKTRPGRLQRSAVTYRKLAIEMGGVLIKVGQFLSSRVDVLPVEIISELAGLQDEVPPEKFEDIQRVAATELGEALDLKFIDFETTPLAAASLGQVHRAKLWIEGSAESGEEGKENSKPHSHLQDVVVKIQRPEIKEIISTDLAALRTVCIWIRRYPPIAKRVDLMSLLREFSSVLYEEIDYLAEGKNAEIFAQNFTDRPGVKVPFVVWSHTTRRVLTLEDVYAIKITDYASIDDAGIDRKEVAKRLFDIYLHQFFEDGFFHADPHPGNLFVDPVEETNQEGSKWLLTFVDFGMVGKVSSNLRDGIREFVIGLSTKDVDRLADAYIKLGILLPHADMNEIKRADKMVFDRFWGMTMAELREISIQEMREFAHEFRDILYSMPFQVPQNMIYLGRAVAILSGMCTGLDPDFNFWENLSPYAQNLLSEEGKSNWRFWVQELGSILQTVLGMPKQIEALLRKFDQGSVEIMVPGLSAQVSRLDQAVRSLVGAVIFLALFIGGIQLYISGQVNISGILLFGAIINLMWVLVVSRRR
jgi:predicted unusual protein kinase regulating ubiquinone biosynthesis (AarF/ABC1/UbiB family)